MGLWTSLKGLLGVAERDQAIATVEAGASPEWKAEALETVYFVATHKDEFTTDEVWVKLKTKTRENRAMGAVMLTAVKMGYVRPTQRFTPSLRPSQHRRPLRVWESTLSGGSSAGTSK
jgi:hypothetical protein